MLYVASIVLAFFAWIFAEIAGAECPSEAVPTRILGGIVMALALACAWAA